MFQLMEISGFPICIHMDSNDNAEPPEAPSESKQKNLIWFFETLDESLRELYPEDGSLLLEAKARLIAEAFSASKIDKHLSAYGKSHIHTFSIGCLSTVTVGDTPLPSVLLPAPHDDSETGKLTLKLFIKAFLEYYQDPKNSECKKTVIDRGHYILNNRLVNFSQFFEHVVRDLPDAITVAVRSLFLLDQSESIYDQDWFDIKYSLLAYCDNWKGTDLLNGVSVFDLYDKNVFFDPDFVMRHLSRHLGSLFDGIGPRFGRNEIVAETAMQYPGMFLPLKAVSAKDDNAEEWRELHKKYPNFYEVTEFVRGYYNRSLMISTPLKLPPILLDGPPGIGKTSYARALSKLLRLPLHVESGQNIREGFDLIGGSSQYAQSQPGLVFETLAKTRAYNPILIFDELDKASFDVHGISVDATLLSLLETETSQDVTEQYFRIPIDASHINWFFTCNDLSRCPNHLVSRLKVFSVKAPNQDEVPNVIQSVYQKVLSEQFLSFQFEPTINELSLQKLRNSPIRDIKRKIEYGINQCFLDPQTSIESLEKNKLSLKPSYLEEKKKKRDIFR